MSHQLTKQNCHPHNQTNVPSSWWWTDWLIACCCCCCSKLSDLTQDMLFSPWVVAVQKANYCMERNVSRFLQFWMRGRQREKREGKVLSCRSHAAFFLPCSETLTGGDKHIWGIGQNCKIGLQMILAWPKKIFAACNCAITPPFMLKTVCATMSVLKSKAWLFVPVVLERISKVYLLLIDQQMKGCDVLALQSVWDILGWKDAIYLHQPSASPTAHPPTPFDIFVFELNLWNANSPIHVDLYLQNLIFSLNLSSFEDQENEELRKGGW